MVGRDRFTATIVTGEKMQNRTNSFAPKACIITVYNSENCGSYWQAKALQEYLIENGYHVFFLKRNMSGSSHTIKGLIKSILKALYHRKTDLALRAIKQYKIFSTETNQLPTAL